MTSSSTVRKLVSRNPANKEIIAETAPTSLDEIPEIVARARQASMLWRQKTLEERLSYVHKFRDLLAQGADAVSKLVTKEAGKPFSEAMVSEVFSVLEACQWLENKAGAILQDQPVDLNLMFFPGKRAFNVFQPLGVIAVVSPWNYPFSIPATSILHAVTAGNAAVLKPSPSTPLIAAALVELFLKAGFPPDLIGLVQGDKDECEALILSGVDRVIFTGSGAGGRAIMGIAARNLVPVTLELGGKHPAIVLPDADPDAAAAGLVWSAFTNAGQACASVDRLFLVADTLETVLPKVVDLVSKLRLGDGMSTDTDLGPVINASQCSRLKEILDDAVAKGAKVLCGGNLREDLGGYFIEPTVLINVNESMRVLKEETFGPVLCVVPVPSAEEALQQANSSELGLTASVWTADLKKGEELARQLTAGVVWLNDGLFTHVAPDAPWGGVKGSGFGKAHSAYELLDLVCVKNISVSGQGKRDWYYPYSQTTRNYIKAGIDLLHRPKFKDRIDALKTLLSLKPKLNK